MRELNINEEQSVNGGVGGIIVRVIGGGIAYDVVKYIVNQAMIPSGVTSSGGQMNHSRRHGGSCSSHSGGSGSGGSGSGSIASRAELASKNSN